MSGVHVQLTAPHEQPQELSLPKPLRCGPRPAPVGLTEDRGKELFPWGQRTLRDDISDWT